MFVWILTAVSWIRCASSIARCSAQTDPCVWPGSHTDFITTAWEEINLNSITRGISRFESAVLIFDRLKNRGIDVPGSEDIAAWVSTASELSTASLQQEVLRSGSLALRKLQEWNNACNRRIQALEPTFKPFPGVEYSLHQLHTVPMWRWFPPPMKALSPASGRVTALPPMPM